MAAHIGSFRGCRECTLRRQPLAQRAPSAPNFGPWSDIYVWCVSARDKSVRLGRCIAGRARANALRTSESARVHWAGCVRWHSNRCRINLFEWHLGNTFAAAAQRRKFPGAGAVINLTKICNYKWAAPVMYGTSSAGEKSEKQKASARGRGFFDVLPFFFSGKGNMYARVDAGNNGRNLRCCWTKRVFPARSAAECNLKSLDDTRASCGRHYDGAAALWCDAVYIHVICTASPHFSLIYSWKCPNMKQ